MINKYGDFSQTGDEFNIVTPDIERNWYNYMYTDNYMTFTSQVGTGQGFIQDYLGNRIMPVVGRGVYLVCGDKGWNLAGLPVYDKDKKYNCIHGLGYTKIQLEKNEIYTEYGLFVPNEEIKTSGYEVIWVKVKNNSKEHKAIKIMSYCENYYDGHYTYQGYNVQTIRFDKENNCIHYPMNPGLWSGEPVHFEGFISASKEVSGYDCAKNAFIGPYGSLADPKAIHNGGCTNSDCIGEKMGFALQNTLELDPNEEGYVSFVLGITESVERINEITNRFSTEEKLNSELLAVQEKYKEIMGPLKIETQDKELDKLLNYWLKYQTNMGSRWARVRHNGFRDIASDTECLAAFNPKLAWERIKRLMEYQYSNGYSPRTFEDGSIRDNRFSDCTVWLTFTVYYIVCELGDLSLLDEEVKFNDGTSASVYEHLVRSVDWLYNFRGIDDLIQIWGGDWNDCMDWAGKKHKGVSVWLTIAWYRANRQLKELAELKGDTKQVEICEAHGKEIADLVDKYGWDEEGKYYITAINDMGDRIGASDCEEGRIFLLPQMWAVLSGISYDGKELIAMESAERELTYELGTAVSTPAYSHLNKKVGSMSIKSPGVQENGGVYLHAMCWKLAVDAMLKKEDKVKEDIRNILPFRNTVVDGRAEPYTLCNSYFGKETGYRYGTPGQSWRTASGQWFLKSMVVYVFGLMPTYEGLKVDPCFPDDWNEAKIVKPFRNCVYNITYKRTGKYSLTVDSQKIDGNVLPVKEGTVEVICEF